MSVDGLDSGFADRLSPRSGPGGVPDARPDRKPKPAESIGPIEQPVPAEDPVPTETDAVESGPRGVIRLLQEGHFKGVADVRLRINFHDELTARAAAVATQTATAGVSELVDNVNAEAQELVDTWNLDADGLAAAQNALSQFDSAAQAALLASTAGGTVDTTRLADLLREAFDLFSGQLNALATPPVPVGSETGEKSASGESEPSPAGDGEQSVIEPVAAADSPAEETPQTADEPVGVTRVAVEPLAQFFADELAGLLASIGEASQLPPMTSEPMGNGQAYDKFVAIYNELTSQETTTVLPAEDDSQVNLVV